MNSWTARRRLLSGFLLYNLFCIKAGLCVNFGAIKCGKCDFSKNSSETEATRDDEQISDDRKQSREQDHV